MLTFDSNDYRSDTLVSLHGAVATIIIMNFPIHIIYTTTRLSGKSVQHCISESVQNYGPLSTE